MDAVESTRRQGDRKSGVTRNAGTLRTFRVPGLGGDEGHAVFKVDGRAVYAVDVTRDTATLTTAAEGTARVVVNFDRRETVEGIIDGRLHPIVAGLQRRFTAIEGDRRFGLCVLLALRASAPAFAEARA